MKKNELSIRDQIFNGTFILIKEPSKSQKHFENLKSYQAFYSDRCNSGKRIMQNDWKTNQMKEVDEVISRKKYLYNWMFCCMGKCFTFDSHLELDAKLNEKSFKVKTSADQRDNEMLYFTNQEIDVLIRQRNSRHQRN